MNKITDNIYYIGADDRELDLFEGQYETPEGISYNSHVIVDEKVAVLDTIDARPMNGRQTSPKCSATASPTISS